MTAFQRDTKKDTQTGTRTAMTKDPATDTRKITTKVTNGGSLKDTQKQKTITV